MSLTLDSLNVRQITGGRQELMMKKPIFRIFVSSTYIDLINYRHAAEKAINDQKQKYEGMEYMGAMDKEPVAACLDLVEQCDLFIGIYAWRYGHVPDTSDISITELEYRHAKQLEKPCLCYLVDKEQPWKPGFIEDGEAGDKLNTFKAGLTKEVVRSTFTESADLLYKIARDLSNWLAENRPDLRMSKLKPGQDPVKSYKKAIAKKYTTLSMIGFNRTFAMDSIYIPLTIHPDQNPRFAGNRSEDDEKSLIRSLKAEELLDLPDRTVVVLGEPGMGKSTMLQYLALRESKRTDGRFPIIVKLADFCKTRDPLESFLLAGVEHHITGASMQNSARHALAGHNALILLDGLDEVSRNEYRSVTERIKSFSAAHEECRIIITSRKAGFQCSEVPFRLFELDQLPPGEIENFVRKWFNGETDLAQRIAVNRRIHELAQNPFLLSIICFIFEKDQSLPQRRVELYQKCAVTLLTLFDEKQIPKQNAYTRRLKEQVLKDIAYHFFCKDVDEFSYESLIEQIAETLSEMGQTDNEEKVLREICENSGLLQKSDDHHFFVHRTFFEYYVSCKMRSESRSTVLSRVSQAEWEEPIRLFAAQIKTIEEGSEFIGKLWAEDRALALRCYPDMARVVEPELIKKLLIQADVNERIELVKGLPEKIGDPEKIVETLRELFNHESNGEVIYWGVQILEKMNKISGAAEIMYEKFDKGAKERYKNYIENDMVCIPAGTFMMGSPDNEYDRGSNETLHEVKLDEFYISRFQVTNVLYEKFDPDHKKRRDTYSDGDRQPVVYVNWYEAVMFCRWLGCRLPVEAEWEYVCRASTNTPFSTGGNLTDKQANYDARYPYKNNPKGKYIEQTAPVGSYPPNAWGIYDMHGNVWEWCQDWYDEKYYETCKGKGTVENPRGPESGSDRVLRGGSWRSNAQDCRSASRGGLRPDDRNYAIGFRLVFVPQSGGSS